MSHLKRILKDWTFTGFIVVTCSLIASLVIGRIPVSHTIIGILLAIWIIMLMVSYARVLEILEEVKSIRIESRNVSITQDLQIISIADFTRRESCLSAGDAVLVFTNTLDYDRKAMFEVVVANLKKGVKHKYILCGDEVIKKDWELFKQTLKERAVKPLPEAVFERVHIAPLIRTTVSIYEYKNPIKAPEATSIIGHTSDSDTCVVLSDPMARHTRDCFWRVWEKIKLSGEERSSKA
jgi:hypothetical protein